MNQIEINNKFQLIKKMCIDDPLNKPYYLELFSCYLRRQVELEFGARV